MAKATAKKTVEIILTLSQEEAIFLGRLLGNHVAGTGPDRDHSTAIWTAIVDNFDIDDDFVQATSEPLNADGQQDMVFLRSK